MSRRKAKKTKAVDLPQPAAEKAAAPPPKKSAAWKEPAVLCMTLLAIYCTCGTWGTFNFANMMGYYDLFADALVVGKLHLLMTPDEVNLVDMVPYEGKWHFQWGPFPVAFHLVARAVGLRLTDRVGAIVAAVLTCLFFFGLAAHLRRRYFPELPYGLLRWFFFAVGLSTPLALIAFRGNVYTENIAISGACIMGALWAFVRYEEEPTVFWAFLCGLGVGFGLLTRITLAMFAFGLFAGLGWIAYRRNQQDWKGLALRLAAFSLPILLCGFLQMGFNQARFGSPMDFGNTYKPEHTPGYPKLALNRIPETFRHYFLAPPKLPGDFPYLEHVGWEPVETVRRAEAASSILLAAPWLLFAIAVWSILRGRGESGLRDIAATLLICFALISFGTLTFGAVSRRYAHDFMQPFVVLAFLGAAWRFSHGWNWKKWAPAGWTIVALSMLLHLQIAFYQTFTTPTPDVNVLRFFVDWTPTLQAAAPGPRLNKEAAIAANDIGMVYVQQKRLPEAISIFEKAAAWDPDSPKIRQNLEAAKRLAGR